MLGYLVPYHGMVDQHKKWGYNQGYLATIKITNKYTVKSKRENNVNKSMNMEDKSVRYNQGYPARVRYKSEILRLKIGSNQGAHL